MQVSKNNLNFPYDQKLKEEHQKTAPGHLFFNQEIPSASNLPKFNIKFLLNYFQINSKIFTNTKLSEKLIETINKNQSLQHQIVNLFKQTPEKSHLKFMLSKLIAKINFTDFELQILLARVMINYCPDKLSITIKDWPINQETYDQICAIVKNSDLKFNPLADHQQSSLTYMNFIINISSIIERAPFGTKDIKKVCKKLILKFIKEQMNNSGNQTIIQLNNMWKNMGANNKLVMFSLLKEIATSATGIDLNKKNNINTLFFKLMKNYVKEEIGDYFPKIKR